MQVRTPCGRGEGTSSGMCGALRREAFLEPRLRLDVERAPSLSLARSTRGGEDTSTTAGGPARSVLVADSRAGRPDLCVYTMLLLGLAHGFSAAPRHGAPRMMAASSPSSSSCPLDALRENCPLTGSSSASKPESESTPPTVFDLLDNVEKRLQEAAGTSSDKPLACTAVESTLSSIARSTCDELGSLSVDVSASSSAGLLLRGELLSASVSATSVAAAGLRASRLALSAPAIDFDIPIASIFQRGAPPSLERLLRPPNLKSPATVSFGVTLTTADITGSPVIFAALQEILRELLNSGVSAAIGEALPRDRSALVVTLVSVEPPQAGRLVLVADAEATQADGNVVRLSGMRVRCTPIVGSAGRLLVLDRPELLSSFEGFGAKLEVGLPFLRAAGLPLPDDLKLTSLRVDEGAIACDGELTLRPIDYDALLDAVRVATTTAPPPQAGGGGGAAGGASSGPRASWSSEAVAVDVEATSVDDDDRYTDDERAALRLPPSRPR